MSETQGLACCGISELADIRYDDSPENSIMNLYLADQAIVVFSDTDASGTVPYGFGSRLAALISRHKLGALVSLTPALNPNTDHLVKAWMWRLNKKAVLAYQRKLYNGNKDLYMDTPGATQFEFKDAYRW